MSAPGIGNLSTLIKRLEAATSRLEDIALHQTSGSSPREFAPVAASVPPPPAATAGAGAGAGAGGAAAETAAVGVVEPVKEDPPTVKAFDEALDEPLAHFEQLSAQIGGIVQQQATVVVHTFQAQRDLILLAASSQKPSGGTGSAAFAELLKPLQRGLMEVIGMRDGNRGEKQYFNHLSTVGEGIPAVGWVAVESKPGVYVGEMRDSAQFYANRVIKDFKDTDVVHVEWCRAFMRVLEVLKAYVVKVHTMGLVWNPKGGDASLFGGSHGGVKAGVPPPPPPAPSAGDVAGGAAVGGGMDAVFGQLNQGETITKSLKKVDASQMTHKNPQLRATTTTTTPAPSKPTPPKPATKPAQLKAKKPAQTHLDGNKWTIEHHEDNRSLVLSPTSLHHTVNIFNCKNCLIQINGKINAVQMTNCVKTSLLIDTLVSSLEITGSPSFAVQITGRVATVLLDSCDSGQIYLSDASLDCEMVAAKCSAVNVSLPVEGGEEGEFEEFALPEQLKHTVERGGQKGTRRIRTDVVAHVA